MKVYIRTLWQDDPRPLWETDRQRDALKMYLNDLGFYVLTGEGNSLEVYAINEYEPWDIKLIKKSLDNVQKIWYTLTRKKKEVNQ